MTYKTIAIAFIIALFDAPAMAGGPWTQLKNSGYAQLSFSSIRSNSLFNNNGESYQLYRQVTDLTFQGYIEYGLTDRLTLVANIPFKSVSTGTTTYNADSSLVSLPFPDGNLSGLGNASLSLKYLLVDNAWKFAAQLKTAANASKADAATGLQTGYDCWSYQPALFAGTSKDAWYAFVSAGVTIRSNHYSESFNATAEAGYGFFNHKTWVILVLDLDKSFLNDSTQRMDYLRTGLYVNNQEYFSYGLKVNQQIGMHWNVNVSLLGAAYGNLVAEAPSLNLGVAYKW